MHRSQKVIHRHASLEYTNLGHAGSQDQASSSQGKCWAWEQEVNTVYISESGRAPGVRSWCLDYGVSSHGRSFLWSGFAGYSAVVYKTLAKSSLTVTE
ncbi:hypothetical protein Pcinc_023798 [Petrolisthes cinctipes]|uniref:Uncharacterized protein n=1 Tax=Petrolisthes cinctipes TaxID=88211 RepID=A0AAE1FBN7_PETCI|nr:hypothetical protein Pcinc_023798 [Petrolisthes cinctipes]